MDRGNDLFDTDGPVLSRDLFPERLDLLDRPIDLFLPPPSLGDDPRYGPPVAGDDNGFAALDIVEQTGQVGLGVRGLDLAYRLLVRSIR